MRKALIVCAVLAAGCARSDGPPADKPTALAEKPKPAPVVDQPKLIATAAEKSTLEKGYDAAKAVFDKSNTLTTRQILALTVNDAQKLFGPPLFPSFKAATEKEERDHYFWGGWKTGDHNRTSGHAVTPIMASFGKDGTLRSWQRLKPSFINGEIKQEWIDEYVFVSPSWVKVGHGPGEPSMTHIDIDS